MTIVYVSGKGDDAHDGLSPGQPVATVARGVALAGADGEVRLTAGLFTGPPIAVTGGVKITGGWDETFTQAGRKLFTEADLTGFSAAADNTTRTRIATTGDRVFAIGSATATGTVRLQHLAVLGPELTAVAAGSSYGIVADGHPVEVDHVVIAVGKGGPGAPGGAGQVSLGSGGGAAGGTGGEVKLEGGPFSSGASGGVGAPGESVRRDAVIVAAGGAGGERGYTDVGVLGHFSNHDAEDGKPGGTGQPGGHGPHGQAAPQTLGAFESRAGKLQWTGAPGGSGGQGNSGAGGGGGGAGGSFSYLLWCTAVMVVGGGAGGPGGRGGTGGGGGAGGACGGGAFGVVVRNATITGTGFAILGGTGGQGGTGGSGGAGSPGNNGYTGWKGTKGTACRVTRHGGTGGPGGAGGSGGSGGGGAGGNGGPLVHIVKIGDTKVVLSGTVHHTAGRAGNGGHGGTDSTGKFRAAPGCDGLHHTEAVIGMA